jgi:hypothetical protein
VIAAAATSDRHPAWHPCFDLLQIGLHLDDLVLAVPFARQEVLQAIGLEPDGTIDEAVLVAAGLVPEGVTVPDSDARRILERASVLAAVRLRQQAAQRSRAAMEFLHRSGADCRDVRGRRAPGTRRPLRLQSATGR